MSHRKKTVHFKVIVAGPPKTGKSSLIYQLNHGMPISSAELASKPTGAGKTAKTDIVNKSFSVSNYEVILDVWDAVGQVGSLSAQFYRESVGVIFLYDSTDPESLEELCKYESKSKKVMKDHKIESMTCFLAANKCDSESKDEENISVGREKAENSGYEFFEVSAETGEGVKEMFQKMAERLRQKYAERTITDYNANDDTIVRLEASMAMGGGQQQKGGCCK